MAVFEIKVASKAAQEQFTKEEFQNCCSLTGWVCSTDDAIPPLEETIIGSVMRVFQEQNDDRWWADVAFNDTDNAFIFLNTVNDGAELCVRPIGSGKISQGRIVDYEFSHFILEGV